MERDNDTLVELIDLGAASVETKGPRGEFPDIADGQLVGGLTND